MARVCQGECRKLFRQGSKNPYAMGDRYCGVCKIFEEPPADGKCYCCKTPLRMKKRGKFGKNRKTNQGG